MKIAHTCICIIHRAVYGEITVSTNIERVAQYWQKIGMREFSADNYVSLLFSFNNSNPVLCIYLFVAPRLSSHFIRPDSSNCYHISEWKSGKLLTMGEYLSGILIAIEGNQKNK